jgi:hypothetical protein
VVDFHLVQALHETRELAQRRAGEGWAEIEALSDSLLQRIGRGSSDPTTEAVGFDRIDRDAIAPEEAERAVAALMAVHDREDDEQVDLARTALQDLRDAMG